MAVLIAVLVPSGSACDLTLAATPVEGDSHRARYDREVPVIPDVGRLIEQFPGVAQLEVDLEAKLRRWI